MAESIWVLDAAGLGGRCTTEVRWMWDRYLAAGMVTLLTSRGKDGKTTLLSLLLERLQSGRPLANAPLTAKKAFVISEEPPEYWKIRADALGLRDHVQWICRPYRCHPRSEEWMAILTKARDARPDLLVIDSLSYFLPEHRENQAERFIEAMKPLHLITNRGCAVLLMHHPRKGGTFSPRGTSALTAFADIILNLEVPSGAGFTDRRRIFRSTSRLGGRSEDVFELTADGLDYVPVSAHDGRDAFEAGWEILKGVLEDAGEELTQKRIQSLWPEDYETPSKATLCRWLQQAASQRRVKRNGRGRSNDAFRYAI